MVDPVAISAKFALTKGPTFLEVVPSLTYNDITQSSKTMFVSFSQRKFSFHGSADFQNGVFLNLWSTL